MTINEGLIHSALLKAEPGDLDDVLTASEAYRICTMTAGKLRRARHLRRQRDQLLECARYCEGALQEFALNGRWEKFEYPPAERMADAGDADLILAIHL